MVERASKPAQAVLKCSLVQSKYHRDAVAEAVMLIAKSVVIKLHWLHLLLCPGVA